MSLDFIETDDGLVMIECNPRPTDGVLLMTAEELERGLLAPEDDTLQIPEGAHGAARLRGLRADLQGAAQGSAQDDPRPGD